MTKQLMTDEELQQWQAQMKQELVEIEAEQKRLYAEGRSEEGNDLAMAIEAREVFIADPKAAKLWAGWHPMESERGREILRELEGYDD